MRFKDWLDIQENGTCTASVAVFARPMLPIVRRMSPVDFMGGIGDIVSSLLDEDEPKKKKKKKSKKKDD